MTLAGGRSGALGCARVGATRFGARTALGIQVIILPGREVPPNSLFGPRLTVEKNLPPGRYGLAVLSDLNSNGEMDNNLLGFPEEPFGFGNDAKINLAPPAFADMTVAVGNGVTETVVNLRNN